MIPAKEFRDILGRFATGVTIVTAQWEGEIYGMTVNSFASVSLVPPLVLFCATPDGRTLALIEKSGTFAVNFLTSQQLELCQRFAGQTAHPENDRFAGLVHTPGAHSAAPLLANCLAHLECRVVSIQPAGDHHVVLAEGISALAGVNEEPLLFFRGHYPTLSAAP